MALALIAFPAVARPSAAEAERKRSGSSPSFEEVKGWIDAYKAAHPGRGGKDADINGKTPAQIAADPAARQLLSLCGKDQRPVIPLLAWEYGGSDHPWKKPEASALIYCVHTPLKDASPNWRYDAAKDHVTADVYVKFPDHNPCKNRSGAQQVTACIGDSTNFEILVDTASIDDGRDVGLSLASASTTLRLILPDATKVHLWDDE
ncbi:MAG TPA: hypothetical protein VKA01_01815 [Vicinamibacteria bacterium]|nr:hypothetical protein [Vicinamibacteria bacterium]